MSHQPSSEEVFTSALCTLKICFAFSCSHGKVATWVTNAGCATLFAALASGALPALEGVELEGTRASSGAMAAVSVAAMARSRYISAIKSCSATLRRALQ